MQFYRNHRDQPGDSELRAETVDSVLSVADSDDVDRVFEFLVDIHTDPAPAVRQRVIEGFGLVAGERASPFIDSALEDDDPDVRNTAERVRESIDDGQQPRLGESTLSDRQLVGRLRNRAGSQLEYFRRELLSRDNAFELARSLLEGDNPSPMRAFRLMQSIDDERGRSVAIPYARPGINAGPRAAAMRLLADHLDGDADDEEAQVIEKGLRARDDYVQLAAMEAAGASGRPDLMSRAIRAAADPDEQLSVTASRALTRGLSSDHAHLLDDLLSALRRIRERRRDESLDQRIKTEAYLLRAIGRALPAQPTQPHEILDEALDSLRDARDHRPILVTGLTLVARLLDNSPDSDGLPASRLQALAALREHPNEQVRSRATTLYNQAVRD
jgi:HEAT repeat protein